MRKVVEILCADFAGEFAHLLPEWNDREIERRRLEARDEALTVGIPAEEDLMEEAGRQMSGLGGSRK